MSGRTVARIQDRLQEAGLDKYAAVVAGHDLTLAILRIPRPRTSRHPRGRPDRASS